MSIATTRPAEGAPTLDVLLVDAALGPLHRFLPDTVHGEVGGLSRAAARGPLLARLGELGAEAGRILTGTSTLAPHRADRRFTDVAWIENPLLKRLVQLYLASRHTAEQLLIEADLDPRDRARVRFFLENVAEAVAPSNVPLVNPASTKAVIDTAGLSLVRGGRQLVKDMVSAPRVPEMVDASGFVVGENIAATGGGVVFRNDVLELIQYAPQTDEVYEVPTLVVPPTINKFYAIDLAPTTEPRRVRRPAGQADVRHLLAQPGLGACLLELRHLRRRHPRRSGGRRGDHGQRADGARVASAPAASSPA